MFCIKLLVCECRETIEREGVAVKVVGGWGGVQLFMKHVEAPRLLGFLEGLSEALHSSDATADSATMKGRGRCR